MGTAISIISELLPLLSVIGSESTLSSSVAVVRRLRCVVSPPWRGWEGCGTSWSVGIGNNSKEANGITLVYVQGKLHPHVGVSFLRDGIFNFRTDFVACREKMIIDLLLISMYLSRLKSCPPS